MLPLWRRLETYEHFMQCEQYRETTESRCSGGVRKEDRGCSRISGEKRTAKDSGTL